MEEKQGCALPLTRFLFGSLGGLLIQLPAVFVTDSIPTWLLAALVGSLLTGFLCLSPQDRIWAPPLAYLFVAGLIVGLLHWRGRLLERDAAPLGALFGGWSLLAAGFAWGVWRRRKSGEGDAFWAAWRAKKKPPTA